MFSHDSCNCCAIPDEYVDEEKIGLKVEDREEKKEEDDNDLWVSDKDVNGTNDDKEEDRPNNTKEEITKNISFVKVVVDSKYLLTLNFDRETLEESNIVKVVSKKILRKDIEMLRKLADKDESKKEKYNNIDDNTKEVEIN